MHSDVRSTLVLLRTQFWIPAGRSFVRSVIRRCVPCRKVEGRSYSYPDPPGLPSYRINSAPPFSAVGIDYTGHLFIKTPSNDIVKVYVCLFACCITRVVHLELAEDLSTDQFLLVFRRFCGRRSMPNTVVSDNGSNLVAGAVDLTLILSVLDLVSYLNVHSVKGIHIASRLSDWGGL